MWVRSYVNYFPPSLWHPADILGTAKQLTVIGRGWANVVICQWRADQLFAEAKLRLRQITDRLWNTDKWRYFAMTAFNNCFIIRSPSLFSYFNHFLAAQVHFSLDNVVSITHEQNITCSKIRLGSTTHEHTIVCKQLFAGYWLGSRLMESEKKMTQRTPAAWLLDCGNFDTSIKLCKIIRINSWYTVKLNFLIPGC